MSFELTHRTKGAAELWGELRIGFDPDREDTCRFTRIFPPNSNRTDSDFFLTKDEAEVFIRVFQFAVHGK